MRLAADLNQSRAAALNVVSDRRGLLQRPAQFRDDPGGPEHTGMNADRPRRAQRPGWGPRARGDKPRSE